MTSVAERMMSAWAPLIAVEQLLGAEALLHVDDVPCVSEAVETAVCDGFGHQDAGHRGPILLRTGPVPPTGWAAQARM